MVYMHRHTYIYTHYKSRAAQINTGHYNTYIHSTNQFVSESYYKVCLGQGRNHSYCELKIDICSCISKPQLTSGLCNNYSFV